MLPLGVSSRTRWNEESLMFMILISLLGVPTFTGESSIMTDSSKEGLEVRGDDVEDELTNLSLSFDLSLSLSDHFGPSFSLKGLPTSEI